MSTLQAKHPIRLIRPAVIEFRFNKPNAYKQQLKFFKRALKPAAADIVATDTTCYFPIKATPKGLKEMELRFVLLKKAQLGNTRTIIYWEVPTDSLKRTSDSLVARHDFKVLEKIQYQPIDKTSQTVLEGDPNNNFIDPNGSSRTLGLVVNPPYPFTKYASSTTATTTDVSAKPASKEESSHSYLMWVYCLAALLIGLMVGRLGRK